MLTVLLLDGRAHGHTLTIHDHQPELWVTFINGRPEHMATEPRQLATQLNTAQGQWELYMPVLGLGPNHHNQHPYDCRQSLPRPPDHRPPHDREHATAWTTELREFLEPLRDAPPPDDNTNRLQWMELNDILTHLHKYRNRTIRLP